MSDVKTSGEETVTEEERQNEEKQKESKQHSWRPQDADREAEKEQIRNRVRNARVSENAVFIPAAPSPTVMDEGPKIVAAYTRVSTTSNDQVSSIENQRRYYGEKIENTPNWTLAEIYSDEGKSGTSMRKRTEFRRMLQDAKDKKIDLILCASVSRFARNVADCMEQVRILRTQNPSHPTGVYFETENIFTLDPNSHQALSMHAVLADWESANKSRRMIISYDQRIHMGQYPLADGLGYRHTKDGRIIIQEDEAKTVRFIFLSFVDGRSCAEIAESLTEMERPTLKGRTDWNGSMVYNIMTNERRWGDLNVRKTVVIDYVKGTTVKNDHIRDAAFVSGHHEGIVSPEIAKAAHMIMESSRGYGGGVSELAVIPSGALKGFVSVSPGWGGVDNDSLIKISESVYPEEELSALKREAAVIQGKEHSKVLSMQMSGYQVPYGVFFMKGSTPSLTVSRTRICFNRIAHDRLGGSQYVELLYHPILQALVLRSCSQDTENAIEWSRDRKTLTVSSHAFCKSVYEKMDWITSFRFRFRGISRKKDGAGILMFFLDEPQILPDKTAREKYGRGAQVQYIPFRNCETDGNNKEPARDSQLYKEEFGVSMQIRKRRDSLMRDISYPDMIEPGVAVTNPLIGDIPSKEELEAELDQLRLSM